MKCFLLAFLFAISVSSQTVTIQTKLDHGGETILVRPKKGAESEADKFHENHGRKVHGFKHTRWHVVRLPQNPEAAQRALDEYAASPLFDGVQENREYHTQTTPNDPLYNQQWAHAKMQSALAWDKITVATNVVVAVCDTGVDFTHPDLAAEAWVGPSGEHGYQAQFGLVSFADGDHHGHGTHCSGIIGAVGNNGVGVVGVSWGIKIMDLRFLGETGSGATSDALLLFDKAIDLRQSGVNLRAINCSWGGPGTDPAMNDSLKALGEAGILVCCAAGNSALDIDVNLFSPASEADSYHVTVMATDQNDALAFFSNFGYDNVDLAAPGVGILSTVPQTNYQAWSGTSMATPFVTGAVGLLFGLNPSLTPVTAKQILMAQDSLDFFGLSSVTGGTLNLNKLVSNPVVPNPVTNHPPVITVTGSNVTLAAGQTAHWLSSATDAENDPITYRITSAFDLQPFYGFALPPLGFGTQRFSVGSATNDFRLTNNSWAVDQRATYKFAALDRIGVAFQMRTAFVYRAENVRTNLSEFITSFHFDTNTFGSFEHMLWVDTNRIDPRQVRYAFQINVGGSSGINYYLPVNGGIINYGLQWSQVTNAATARAYVWDTYGNFGVSTQAVIRFAPNVYVPEVKFTVNTNRGPVPLTVTFDTSASNPSNRPSLQAIRPWSLSSSVGSSNSITLTNTGSVPYEVWFLDKQSGVSDSKVVMLSALPGMAIPPITNEPPPITNPPPVIDLSAPTNLALHVSGNDLTLSWKDTATGEGFWEVQKSTKKKGPWSSFSTQAILFSNSSAYFVNGTSKTGYRFRVRAGLGSTNGPFSNVASGNTP